MSDDVTTNLVSVLMAVIGVAIIAVLISKNADTANVLKAGGMAFGGILSAATAPVTGGSGGGLTGAPFPSLQQLGIG
jgi:PRD1 phage membrane DNA delivery